MQFGVAVDIRTRALGCTGLHSSLQCLQTGNSTHCLICTGHYAVPLCLFCNFRNDMIVLHGSGHEVCSVKHFAQLVLSHPCGQQLVSTWVCCMPGPLCVCVLLSFKFDSTFMSLILD